MLIFRFRTRSRSTRSQTANRSKNMLRWNGAIEWLEPRENPVAVSSIVSLAGNPTNAATIAFMVTFTEPVTGVDVSDFKLTTNGLSGPAIAQVSGAGDNYTVNVNTGSGDGTLLLNLVDDDSIVDAGSNPLGGAGVGNGSAISPTTTIDRAQPTANLTTAAHGTVLGPFSVNVAFNEVVTGFAADDLTVTNGTVTGLTGSGKNYNATVTPTVAGIVEVSVAAGQAVDAAGNLNTASDKLSRLAFAAGGELAVNTTTAGDQKSWWGLRNVATDSTGNFFVVWDVPSGIGSGVYGRRYSAAGVPLTGDFKINTSSGGGTLTPSVAVDADGDAIVVWNSGGIYGQRFNASGSKVDGEFRVDTPATTNPWLPSVAVGADGDAVVVWTGSGQNGYGLYGQRFDEVGSKVGDQFQVNSQTAQTLIGHSVAMDVDGDAVVVWSSDNQLGGFSIYGQRFNSAGSKIGGEFPVSLSTASTTSREFSPSVAVDADGDAIVVWLREAWDGGIYGQRFDAVGFKVGGEFRVSTFAPYSVATAPSVAMDADGDAIVVWSAYSDDGVSDDIFGQCFTASGSKYGIEFQVNTYTTGSQWFPSVAMDADGDVVVMWESGQDGSGAGIVGRQISVAWDANTLLSGLSSTSEVTVLGAFTVSVQFTEDVTGFEASDVSVINGSVGGFSGSGANYSFTVTPAASGGVDVTVVAGKAANAAGNLNTASNTLSRLAFVASDELAINTTTAGSQEIGVSRRSVATDATGNVIVVWQGPDGNGTGIFGRRYSAAGTPIGGEILINSYTIGNQRAPSVAVDEDGDTFVVWQSSGQDGSGYGIYGQRFDEAGSKVGGEFRINTSTIGNQRDASVAMDADGDALVVWASGMVIYGQWFDATGAKVGAEIRVDTLTSSYDLFSPLAAMNANGDAVVVWGHGLVGLYGQRFNAAGSKVGGQFQIATTPYVSESQHSVAVDADGDAVVVWLAFGSIPGVSTTIINCQRYDAAGSKVGGEFQVNTFPLGNVSAPSVALDGDGDAIVVWQSSGQDGSGYGIYGQRFDSAGSKVGGEFKVNTYATNSQESPSVAMDADGDTFVVWKSEGQDGSSWGIYGRQIASPNPPTRISSIVIADGSAQRSIVKDITVTFGGIVTFPTDVSSAFAVNRTGPGGPTGPVTITVDTSLSTPTQTIAKLTFSGALTQFGSLVDGDYSLRVFGNLLSDAGGQLVDADGNGIAGGTNITNLHRLFGDGNGDGMVNFVDFASFRSAFGTTGPSPFDFDGDNQVTAADFNQFRLRYGVSLTP